MIRSFFVVIRRKFDFEERNMKPIKKVRFVDFDSAFVPEKSWILKFLSQWYDIRIVKKNQII